MKAWILLLFLVSPMGETAPEIEILWLKFDKVFTYQDIDRFCSTDDLPSSLYFGAELKDGHIRAAAFKTNTFEPLSQTLPFTEKEISGVKLSLDSFKRRWIESINLNARQFEWIFTRAGGTYDCVPTQKITTIIPNNFNYSFDLNNMLSHPAQANSSMGKFSGELKSFHVYEASLYLIQKQIKN